MYLAKGQLLVDGPGYRIHMPEPLSVVLLAVRAMANQHQNFVLGIGTDCPRTAFENLCHRGVAIDRTAHSDAGLHIHRTVRVE